MKRRKLTSAEMTKSKSSSSTACLKSDPPPPPIVLDESSLQVDPGFVIVDGRGVPVNKAENVLSTESGGLPRVAELSLSETEVRSQDVDFNDRFPDELLLSVFKYVWRPVHCWSAAKVCKRWCILQTLSLLKKRCNREAGSYSCTGSVDEAGRRYPCHGSSCSTLKLSKVESEWRLANELRMACRRHTHALEIKDCTHVSVRGYQLIAAFTSTLKSLRLDSCNSMDDPSFDGILDRCASLQSIHLSNVPKLTLKTVEKKGPKLRELHVHGCPKGTASTVLSILNGCPNLRTLCLSAMGPAFEWDESKIVEGPPYRLQTLELGKTSGVTDAFLRALTGRLPNLRRLSLTNCPMLSDDGLKAFIAVCGRGLQRLVVTWCAGVSDDSIRELANVAENLQDISLAGTNVSDRGLEALMASTAAVKKLRNLSVAGCRRVTDAGLQYIIDRQRHLHSFKTLDVQSCPEVSIFGLEALRNAMTRRPWKIVSDKVNVKVSQ